VNRSDTGLSLDEVWNWEFGDIFSGEDNYSVLRSPSHYYDNPGTWTVRLDVNSDNGCSDYIQKTLAINIKPAADFAWNSNCLTSDPIRFKGEETLGFPDTVSSRMWTIYRGNTEIFSSDADEPSYLFPSEGSFRINYSIVTSTGCTDTTIRTLTMKPTYILSEDPYFEDFEMAQVHGWTSMGEDPLQNSWTYGGVSSAEFPETASSGTHAWYTDLPEPREVEKSWVQSPCFNFIGFYRPMVSLDIKRSLSRNQDGAALQYTTDNGRTWYDVGGVEDGGMNWYNSDNILNGDGGQHTGWTAESESAEDDRWYNAAHGLDQLTWHMQVQFRIVFNSMGGDATADGFAFDNFSLKQRSRLSVLEYFTNANAALCYRSDSLVHGLMTEVPADVVDIQYHAAGSVPDKMYLDNPVPANNRGTVYGVTGLPMAVLDGGHQEWQGYPQKNDFNERPPRSADIKLRSLSAPDFKITMLADFTPYLELSVEIEALQNMSQAERILYAVVMEKMMAGPEYTGTNGSTSFFNVARIMIPDAAGTLLNQSWTKGQVENIHLTCEETFFPMIKDSLAMVVYLQDEVTGEILQAATIPEYSSVAVPELQGTGSGVVIYPNPAGELVHIFFEDEPGETMQLTLYDLSGKLVITDLIDPWQRRFSRSLGGLDRGLYIVEIRTRNKKHVIHRDKLFHY
jgi:PKD repeat protein